jgi:hypothetical protein
MKRNYFAPPFSLVSPRWPENSTAQSDSDKAAGDFIVRVLQLNIKFFGCATNRGANDRIVAGQAAQSRHSLRSNT